MKCSSIYRSSTSTCKLEHYYLSGSLLEERSGMTYTVVYWMLFWCPHTSDHIVYVPVQDIVQHPTRHVASYSILYLWQCRHSVQAFVLLHLLLYCYTSALCLHGVTRRRRVPDEMTWKQDSAPGQQRMWREYVNEPGSRGYLVFVRWMKFSPLFSSFPLSHLCD